MAGVRGKAGSQKAEVSDTSQTAGTNTLENEKGLRKTSKSRSSGKTEIVEQEDLFSGSWANQVLDAISKSKARADQASSEGRSLREMASDHAVAQDPKPNQTILSAHGVAVIESTRVLSSASSDQVSVEVDSLNIAFGNIPELIEPPKQKVFTVSELSTDLRDTLRESFGQIQVQAEICDFKGIHRNGHCYFALKDDKSQIRAVMWKTSLQKLPFELKGGLEVVVTGRLDYYGGSGSLQIIVERVEPKGMGALQLKFEQLKEKLKLEGLFDQARKRPVRPLNWRIGVVTSRTGAALQDILKIFKTRFPLAEVFVFHSAVQGEAAPREICKAVALANRYSAMSTKPLDVLIVGRGGGSYEDLFCFNDESVIRALCGSKIPIVSAVGHEIDTTLSDHAADRRSATPSHAAQETVPEMALWLQRLEDLTRIFERRTRDVIVDYQLKVDTLYNRMVAAAPQKKLAAQKQFLKDRELLLLTLMQKVLMRYKSSVQRSAAVLDALSPLKVLERGYAVATQKENGLALRSVNDAKSGTEIELLLSDGKVAATIV